MMLNTTMLNTMKQMKITVKQFAGGANIKALESVTPATSEGVYEVDSVLVSEALTRTCTTIVGEGVSTEVIEPTGEVEPSDVARFVRGVAEGGGASVVVCMGSLPPGAGDDFYGDCIRACEAAAEGGDLHVVVDVAERSVLRGALDAVAERGSVGRCVVKCNRDEVLKMTEAEEVPGAVAEIAGWGGVTDVLITDGREDAWVWGRGIEGVERVKVEEVDVVNSVGAGDCTAAGHLLSSSPPNATVNVEYTRATVDKSHGTGIKRYAYWDERPCSVVRSRWFFIEDGSGRPGKDNPQPLCEADDDAVEGIYMEGLTAEERELDWGGVGGYKATWGDGKEGEKCIKIKPTGLKGLVNPTFIAVRGHPMNPLPGEADEATLDFAGSAGTVIYVVHGIGEQVWSKDNAVAKSLIKQCNDVRVKTHRLQIERYERRVKKWDRGGRKGEKPEMERRVEVLPVCWYEVWHTGTDIKRSVESVTLPGVPIVRTIANSIILDVIMYMEGNLREKVLGHVSKEITDIYGGYLGRNQEWGGSISIVGHSLGSVIAWDIADRYMQEQGRKTDPNSPPAPPAPTQNPPTLPSSPQSVFLLGSPVGLFLSIRGSHTSMLGGSIYKGSTSFYNVIHGSDPVSYRIEPLMLPTTVASTTAPAPAYIPSSSGSFLNSGGLLPHNHAEKTVEEAKNKVKMMGRMAEGFFKGFAGSVAEAVGGAEEGEGGEGGGEGERESEEKFRVCEGGNDRVDWILQAGAVWDMYGRHRQVVGPALVRMWYSHIRFLDKHLAGPTEFLKITHNDGSLEHIKGPVTAYANPVLHRGMKVDKRRDLNSEKEHLVVFRTRKSNVNNLKGEGMVGQEEQLERKIITGPTVFMPEVNDRIHNFKFSGSAGEKTFEILNEDQSYENQLFKVKTAGGIETTVKLSLDVTITNLSKFVTGSFDLPKEIARSTSADIVNHCDCKWDEIDGFMKLLTARSQREPSVFSNLKARLDSMGVSLNGITYVGSTASSEVLRKHKEEADKADTAENEDRELAKERQREKERQKTELDRIDLEGKVADTKIRQDRQR
ncbi:hypothetical protein TrRE_jg12496, partial [Triparma retinervis]